ncbi:MAG: dihydroneopterin aldolase family protein [Methanobacterium sp.]|jgi:hypothetical protein
MNVYEKYFKLISKRERAIFEGAITMGALFHQFIGTPVNSKTVDGIEKAMKEAMELQPCINEVKIIINREMLGQIKNEFQYISLSGDMLDIKVFSEYEGHMAVIRMKFIEELQYPLMYVEEVK